MKCDLSSALTTAEAAERLRVNPRTVQRWAREGRIPAYRDPSGNYRYDPADFTAERLLTPVQPKGRAS